MRSGVVAVAGDPIETVAAAIYDANRTAIAPIWSSASPAVRAFVRLMAQAAIAAYAAWRDAA